MSVIDNNMRIKFAEVIRTVVDTWTKIDYEGSDYELDIKLNEGKWIFTLTPKNDYGAFALKKIFERHTTEELKQG